jgi:predicted O-methyltransferase YrrM
MQNRELTIDSRPWLTEQAIEFIENLCRANSNLKILEFGSGGSTIWFAQRTNNLVSIEHNPKWYNLVSQVLENLSPKQNSLITRKLLNPPAYYQICAEFPDNYFDLILIDAIERVNCATQAVRILKLGGVLMLDNCERPQYLPIYENLKTWSLTKTQQIVMQNNQGITHYTDWWIKPN